MKKHNQILYLASQSASRRQLLIDSDLPFEVISQTADEASCDWGAPPQQLVASIAQLKMDHVAMPAAHEGDIVYVLTADTVTCDCYGTIHGKPRDHADAVDKIKLLGTGKNTIYTGFFLQKRQLLRGEWQTIAQKSDVVSSWCEFVIPDDVIAQYVEKKPVLHIAGGLAIEEYGMQFVRSINGSYTGIIGLPMFELRQALTDIGFFSVSSY
jgi:septum formation protein